MDTPARQRFTTTANQSPGSPVTGDVAMWDDAGDQILSENDVVTPRGVDQDLVQAVATMSKACPPDCACRQPMPQWIQAASRPLDAPQEIEPLTEPSADEIPWSDLAYWLGSEQENCSCATCQHEQPAVDGHYLYIPASFYSRLSLKIPVISLPRIEGLN